MHRAPLLPTLASERYGRAHAYRQDQQCATFRHAAEGGWWRTGREQSKAKAAAGALFQ